MWTCSIFSEIVTRFCFAFQLFTWELHVCFFIDVLLILDNEYDITLPTHSELIYIYYRSHYVVTQNIAYFLWLSEIDACVFYCTCIFLIINSSDFRGDRLSYN